MSFSVSEYMGILKTKIWLYTENHIKRSALPEENYSLCNLRVERFISLWTKLSADQLTEHALLF